MPFLKSLFRCASVVCRRPAPVRWRPRIELLDDRITPTVSSIAANLNLSGTDIPANSTLWFNSVLKVSGLGSSPVTIHVDQVHVSSSKFDVDLPDADITFSPTATTATTTFDAATNTWETTVPSRLGGKTFLDGGSMLIPAGRHDAINRVTWSANFTSDTPGVRVKWQWAAADYRSFSADYNALDVKPVNAARANPYHNSDRAGTPEAFKRFVNGAAQGGGRSEFTGSYSDTKALVPELVSDQQGASLSGTVFSDSNGSGTLDTGESGISDVTVTLAWTDAQGDHTLTTTTDDDGNFSFTGLAAGSYTLTVTRPQGYVFTDGLPGTASTTLGANDSVTGFNFGMIVPS